MGREAAAKMPLPHVTTEEGLRSSRSSQNSSSSR